MKAQSISVKRLVIWLFEFTHFSKEQSPANFIKYVMKRRRVDLYKSAKEAYDEI